MRLLSALALTAALCATPALAGQISISGTGEVAAAPNMAYVNSGVTSQGATAAEALAANTAAMNELIATLKAAGIEARDIQTSGFSVSPNYVYSDARDANGYQLPPKVSGYQVYNTVNVRVRDLSTLGAVLDKAVTVGANTINGVSFSVADPEPLLDQARKLAFADARKKAELYADVAGEKLGDIESISESQGYGQPQPQMMRAVAESDAGAPVPIESGELSFSINVQVAWELED